MTPSYVERTKLLANALDRVSTACVTVGIATPIAGYVYNVSNVRALVSLLDLLTGIAGWFLAAVVLHLGARRVLKGLDR